MNLQSVKPPLTNRDGAGQAQAENGEQKRWSALVFAQRKLMVVALNFLLARCTSLGFIKSDALIGAGGKLLASSQTVKV